jgi:putative glutamine amidotransferase
VTPRILVPARTAKAGKLGRNPVAYASSTYLDALARARALEMVVAPRPLAMGEAKELVDQADGLLLLGGPDVDPALYGEEAAPETYGVHRLEDDFEIALLLAAIDMNVPVLAVCRGFQVLNVALGGDLHQHITGQAGLLEHSSAGFPAPAPGTIGPVHEVPIEAGSRLAEALGTTVAHGSSSHHQALRRIGSGLVVTGRTSDGIVEAVELESASWVVGVQWHPEDTAAHDPVQQRLFDTFAAKARR